ncbi:MAG: prephenate dehydrogenase/arogenate dehydrogenase family protein, partial [Proteobacteria bacterium]
MIRRLCVIGVGLIGGSLARALRVVGAVETIVGCGRGEKNLARARELNVIDEYMLDPADAVEG